MEEAEEGGSSRAGLREGFLAFGVLSVGIGNTLCAFFRSTEYVRGHHRGSVSKCISGRSQPTSSRKLRSVSIEYCKKDAEYLELRIESGCWGRPRAESECMYYAEWR